MDLKSIKKQLEDIQETLEYEIGAAGRWDDVPKNMQLDIKEQLNNLTTAVYAALGYSLIHPKQ